MLTSLHVKDLALIREAEVNFSDGLNILTGETGAGKSIIIGSINYALGAKVEKDVVREGAEYALVELIFQVEREETRKQIQKMELPMEEDGSLIITRKIMQGRSVLKVGGEAITTRQMKELAALLIDIHGQHEHQSLLQIAKHQELLDSYVGEELKDEIVKITELYGEYTKLQGEIASLSMDDATRQREIALAQFEVDEIETAALTVGEDEILEKKYRKLVNAKKIADSLNHVMDYLANGESNAKDQTGYAVREMNMAITMDEELNDMAEHLMSAESILSDVSREIAEYMDEFSFDEEDFRAMEERLNVINHLTLKYGRTIEEVLTYGQKKKEELNRLLDLEGTLQQLRTKRAKVEKELCIHSECAHEIRLRLAKELEKNIAETLLELNFLKVTFEIAVRKKETYSKTGFDEVEFMISLNPGERVRPLTQVASGGELSRIMLALKSIFARKDAIDTLIFDEIDTGISGKTAWKVSEKMSILSEHHQVICITHLPQIAAMADTHFVIEKAEWDGKTVTSIQQQNEAETIDEIARLLGSDCITDAVRTNAVELRELAKKTKTKTH